MSRVVALVPVALFAVLSIVGCQSKKSLDSTSDMGPGKLDGGTAFNSCVTPNEGCACDDEGQEINCGSVKRRSGDYVACSKGTRTCQSGHWSACVGDSIVEMQPPPSERLNALGGSQACSDNPCDPYCYNAIDDPNGIPQDGGFTLLDGGLVLDPEILQIGHPPVCTGITVSPATATINVTTLNSAGGGYTITTSNPAAGNPAQLQLTATEVPAGCVNPLNAVWSLDRLDLATISNNGVVTLASPIAATLTATAYAGTYSASVSITVNVTTLDTTNLPVGSTVATTFAAAGNGSGADVPNMKVLYPYANTVFPLGLSSPLIQWDNGGTQADAVKVGLVYYPVGGSPQFKWEQFVAEQATNPRYQVPQAIWQLFERSAKGQDAAYTVQRMVGGTVRTLVTRPIHFATAPLRGRIVYTEYGRADGHAYIRSADPGGTAPAVNVFPANPAGTLGTRCPACHTVSANGSIFATSNNIWSGSGGISTINAAGAFTHIGGDYDGNAYNAGSTVTGYPDSLRGFSWSAITPDGQMALTGNEFWGNTRADIPTWPTAAGSTALVVGANNGNGTLTLPNTTISGGNGLGLRGSYYNNTTFAGTPWVRTDPRPFFNWAAAAPGGPVTNANAYSVRWTGLIQPFFTENVNFTLNTTADVSLVINGTTVIAHNGAAPGALAGRTGAIALTAGQRYTITVELIKSGAGNGQIELRWSGAKTIDQTVPQSQLYNDNTGSDVQNGVLVSYFDNSNLGGGTGTPPPGSLFQRVEPEIASTWGTGSPSCVSPTVCTPSAFTSADAFSSSWDGLLEAPYTGTYQFRARGEVNDAVKVQLDINKNGSFADAGETLIDQPAGAAFTAGTAWTTGVDLVAGNKYPIHVEHKETGGNALLGVDWQVMSSVGPGGVIEEHRRYPGNAAGTPWPPDVADTPPTGATPWASDFSTTASLIDFNWGATGPAGLCVPPGWGFTSRFTAKLYPIVTGDYTFYLRRNDGARLFVSLDNGATYQTVIANGWGESTGPVNYLETPSPATVHLIAGNVYPITVIHYYSPNTPAPANNIAVTSLLWSATGVTKEIIPAARYAPPVATLLPAEQIPSEHLFPPATYAPTNGLRATYYNSRDWNNSAPVGSTISNLVSATGNGNAFTRIEATVNNDWADKHPQYYRIAADDNYSVRYVGKLIVPVACAGTMRYVFQLDISNTTNDSAALWIDNTRIVNGNYQGTLDGVIDLVGGSVHDIKIDYLDNDGLGKVKLLWDPPAACEAQAGAYLVPTSALAPVGSGGAGGGVRAGGDNANGGGYYVWQLPQAVGQNATEITGQSVGRWGLAGTSMMVPSFSPDGKKLVFVNGDSSNGAGWRKGLSIFDFDSPTKFFSNKKLIVNNWPSGDFLKWPTFESDSHSVIYQTTTPVETDINSKNSDNTGNTSYGGVAPSNYFQVPGRLWSVDSAAATPTPVELLNLTQGEQAMDKNKSFQPTVLPVAAAGYRWAVFTSTRPYGNQVNTTNNQSYANIAAYTPMTDKNNHQSMLWVGAIDDTPSAGTDRSHPPFFLPNQNYAADPTQGYVNERGFWALSACTPVGDPAPCDVNEDCCGGSGATPTAICKIDTPITNPVVRHCIAKPPPNACVGEGLACVVNADCCINDGLVCGGNGLCQKPPPIDVAAYSPVNFERIYEGDCPVDSIPIWHFFDWQASAPPTGSYIEFYAQTAADPNNFITLPPAPTPITDPNVVYLGAAQPGDPTGWVGADVAAALTAKGLTSQYYLKITMRFAPNTENTASPILTNWRQAHSCQPAQ